MIPLALMSIAAVAYYGGEPEATAGRSLYEVGHAVGAEASLKKALQKNPYDVDAWTSLGKYLEEGGRLEEALSAYEKASGLDPESDRLVQVARVQLRLGEVDTAALILEENLRGRPFNLESLKLLGWIYMKKSTRSARSISGFSPQQKMISKADEHFQMALHVSPSDPEALLGRALASEWTNHKENALGFLNEALAIDTTSYWGWQIKGNVLKGLGRERDAREAYEMAEKYSKGRPYTLVELAELARRDRSFIQAADYSKGIGNVGAFSEGIDLMAAQDFVPADTAFLEALSTDPEDELALDRLEEVRIKIYTADDPRRIELANRRLMQAEKAEGVRNNLLAYLNYIKAVRLAPQFSEARLKLARFYEKIGSFGLAAMELARVDELTRSQKERVIAADLMEVITRKSLTEMEKIHEVEFRELWEKPTSELGRLIGDPETLEARIRWGVNPVARPRVRIAILPLNEVLPPAHITVGKIASGYLSTALGLFPGFELVPQKEILDLLEKYENDPANIDIGKVSRELDADMLITGKIFEDRENVSLNITAIKAPSGPVVSTYRIATSGPRSLTRAVLEISRNIANVLPLEGKVIRRKEGSTLTINLGRLQGLNIGDTISIIRKTRELVVPGLDWLQQREEITSVGKVVGLTEQYSEVEPVWGSDTIRAGDLVRRQSVIKQKEDRFSGS